MNKNLKLVPFIIIAALMFVYTKDIKQFNNEYLFLESESVITLTKFKEKFPELETLIVQDKINRPLTSHVGKLLEICADKCDIIGFIDGESVLDPYTASSLIIANRLDEENMHLAIINYLAPYDNISIAGHAYTNSLLDDYSKIIQEQLFPIMFLVCFILILVLVRKILLSVVIFFPALFSSLISLSCLKFFYGSMNMVTSIVPLMCFVIIMCLGQHIYFGVDDKNSVDDVLKYKTKPILLMLSTTSIGFLSLCLSSISVIRTFGLLTAVLIIVTSVIAIFWYSLSSSFFENKVSVLAFIPSKFFETSFSKITISFLVIISVASIFYMPSKIEIVTDATKYFPKKSLLKETIDKVTSSVGGIPILEIGIVQDHDFSYEDLLIMDKFEQEIMEMTNLKLISNNTIVKEINIKYAKMNSLPSSIYAYTALRSKAPIAFKDTYALLTQNYHLTILGNSMDLAEYEVIVEKIKVILEKSKINYELNGLYYNLMISQREMITTLAKSFLTSLIVIVLIAFIFVRKIKVVTSFIVVNVLPVGLSFTFMFLTNMSLNIATVMTYSIALGMVVDSSFHLIHALEAKNQDFENYVSKNIMPIISSSIILCLSFLLFILEDFIPIQQFGLNLFFIILCGLIFDLLVLPTLYLGTKKTKEYLNE